ncbi:MAG: hypothetical protein LQ350_002455 [Teloschistes chrysophthalmus]|nr:MAG: hypothetical protein LQ350_002455 [Niorma chrysophthalma]
MSRAIVDLNWRDSKSKREILEGIGRLFAEADAQGEVPMINSQVSAKSIIKLELVNNVLMVTREDRTRKVANQHEYWARLLELATCLYNMQVEEQSIGSHFIEYRDVDPAREETMPTVKRRMLDLALITGSPPVALGVKYSEGGQLNIPEGTTIELIIISNTFKFNERYRNFKKLPKDCFETRKLGVGPRGIPFGAYSLKVRVARSTGRRIDAVIVVEHRNIAGVITEHDYALKDVLVVMSTERYGKVWKEGYRITNRNTANEVLATDFNVWKRKVERKVRGKFVAHTKMDEEVHQAFQKIGWLDHEPLAKHEVELIRSSQKAKFRLADLTVVDVRYIRQFFEAKLQKHCKKRPLQRPEPPTVLSSSVSRGSPDLVTQLSEEGAAEENFQTPREESSTNPAADPQQGSAEPNRSPTPGTKQLQRALQQLQNTRTW